MPKWFMSDRMLGAYSLLRRRVEIKRYRVGTQMHSDGIK